MQVPFKTIEGQRKPKVIDWLTFQRTCVDYAFFDVVPTKCKTAFYAMVDALNDIMDATADYDPDAEDKKEYLREVEELQVQVVRALVLFERDFPRTEMTPCIHWIVHPAKELIPRWNNVRNYWCFLTERFVGWMKSFVHNRALAVENMVRGYTRGQLMRAVGPKIRRKLLRRMHKLDIDTSGLRSFLDPPKQKGKTRVGSGEVGYVVHSRNSKKRQLTCGLRTATTTYLKGLGIRHLMLQLGTTRINSRICISGRYLARGATGEFVDEDPEAPAMLMVGDVVGFAVLKYKHVKGRRGSRKYARGEVVMVRVKVFDSVPVRSGNLYTCPKKRKYKQAPVWVSAKHLTAFLHEVPDRAGDQRESNLVTIARVLVS